ncbi:MAG: hypothetical protein ACREQI_14715 [Candidatus Binataceae bacterium]
MARSTQMLTAGAAVSAAIVMVFFFQAPIVPVAAGALIATVYILRRNRNTE